jgi:translation initiation factor IF-3
MRIKFHRIEQVKKEEKRFFSNYQIKSPQVFLIDESGESIGVIDTEEAIARAKELEMDLVEVNPKADPPIAKILDLGQFKYEQQKKAHKQKMMQKKVELKNIRLTFRISEHDFNFRLDQAEKFLFKDNKLKVDMLLRGRERQHLQKAAEIMNGFVNKLKEKPNISVEIEQPLTTQGGRFSIILINKK